MRTFSEGRARVCDKALSEFVGRIIGACHAKQANHITIAGRRTIQAVVDLCRRGYENVMCRTADRGPHVSENVTDFLWILNVRTEAELRTLIAGLAPDLRLDGVLTLAFEVSISWIHASRFRRLLIHMGFEPVHQALDSSGRTLLICGRRIWEPQIRRDTSSHLEPMTVQPAMRMSAVG
jgi:hypothetical protein